MMTFFFRLRKPEAYKQKTLSRSGKLIKFEPNLFNRRSFLVTAFTTTIAAASLSCMRQGSNPQTQEQSSSSTQAKEIRVVYSKMGPLAVLRNRGTLDQAAASRGYSIKWLEFAAGPQQLEALNAGSLDISSTAESPVIFAQAAGTPLVYLSTTVPNPKGVAFLVPNDSSIRSIADFKGKQIALQKASVAQYVLVKGLEKSGLKFNDVTPVYLAPPDANVAFSQAKVDAWIIWEPFIGRVEQQQVGRTLQYGDGLKDVGNFYSAHREFAQANPEFIKLFLEEVQKAEEWSKDNPRQLAELLSPEVGIEVETLETIYNRQQYGLQPITAEVIATQQRIADMYYDLGLLPKKLDTREVALTPEEYAAFTPKELAL